MTLDKIEYEMFWVFKAATSHGSKNTIHYSVVHVNDGPWSGPTYYYLLSCEGLVMLSPRVGRDICGYGSSSDNCLRAVSGDMRSYHLSGKLSFLPELWFPANKVGLTEHLPSLLVTTGGPGVPSHSWALTVSLEDAPWCPFSLLSSFGSGSVLWLRTFSSSVGSVC